MTSNALVGVNSLREFKERASEFPGVIRWAFGEKVQSPKHAAVRPIYDGLLSDGGKEAIISLKSDYLSKVSKALIWKFMLMTVPLTALLVMGFAEYVLQANWANNFTQISVTIAILCFAYLMAKLVSNLYVSSVSKL